MTSKSTSSGPLEFDDSGNKLKRSTNALVPPNGPPVHFRWQPVTTASPPSGEQMLPIVVRLPYRNER
jgi:hypothetical protein